MTRRMFFLFPDHSYAEQAVRELEQAGVARARIHAVARKGISLGSLPRASAAQAGNRVHRWELMAWNANQVLFWSALVGALIAAFNGAEGWVATLVAVMIACFIAGLLDTKLPTAHLEGMRGAIEHGEIVLMVDQPAARVKAVEDLLQRHHPEAVIGGVGWTIEALE